jgi:erythromycin esterase-like protein
MKNHFVTDPPGFKNAWQEQSFPLHNAQSLDPLMDRIGNAQLVLLGEATHGTHEFYTWRTAITKRLIEEKGFRFIAVEGDWPDCYKINRYIKGYDHQTRDELQLLGEFSRWPTWLWANWETAALVSWLHEYNSHKPNSEKAGFYGLDVYSLWESMDALVHYLDKTDPLSASLARKAIQCFEPYHQDGRHYAQAQLSLPGSCKEPVIRLLQSIRSKAAFYDHDPEAALNSEQNAVIAVEAEKYYRSMVGFDHLSWNIRDQHMHETLQRLMAHHGKQARGIVWEHNTHIGDARYTDMESAGMINLGQLVRNQYGDKNVVLVGFGCYKGQVIAGREWGAPMEIMNIPPARKGSMEALLHEESAENRLLLFNRSNRRERFKKNMLHRAIGVVYHPNREQYGNYVPSFVNDRYDAFIYLDETQAVHPLPAQADLHKTPDTYPFEL